MSKFYFSTISFLNNIQSISGESGSVLSGKICTPQYEFATFSKLCVKDLNFKEIGEDFIAITGTLLYKGLRGADLLSQVFSDYIERGDSLRSTFWGNYAVIIKHGNRITFFGEETYFYDIFYYCKEGSIVVSNDLYSIYRNVANLEVDKHNVLEQAYLNGVIGNETVLKDVYRLSGDQKIVIDIKQRSLRIEAMPVDWTRVTLSFDESVEELTSSLKNEGEVLKSAFKSTAICMTGGLDSRLSFAALIAGGNRPSLYYGVGDSPLTNTHNEDLEICKLFSETYNLSLTTMDWSTPTPIDLNWDQYLDKYGLLYHAYASSGHVMSSLEDIKEEYVTLGLVGELFRTLDFTETRKYFTIEEYVDEYYLPKNEAGTHIEKRCEDFPAFRKRLIEKYTGVCKRFNLDPDNMKVEDFFYLNLEYRANADNVMLNLINRMRYCSWLLGAHPVIKLANVNSDYLKKSHYMLCALEKLCPECLEIPVFSHQRKMVYNKYRKKLLKPTKVRIRHVISSFLPKCLKKQLIAIVYKETQRNIQEISPNVGDIYNDYWGKDQIEVNISYCDMALIQYIYALGNKCSVDIPRL